VGEFEFERERVREGEREKKRTTHRTDDAHVVAVHHSICTEAERHFVSCRSGKEKSIRGGVAVAVAAAETTVVLAAVAVVTGVAAAAAGANAGDWAS